MVELHCLLSWRMVKSAKKYEHVYCLFSGAAECLYHQHTGFRTNEPDDDKAVTLLLVEEQTESQNLLVDGNNE